MSVERYLFFNIQCIVRHKVLLVTILFHCKTYNFALGVNSIKKAVIMAMAHGCLSHIYKFGTVIDGVVPCADSSSLHHIHLIIALPSQRL